MSLVMVMVPMMGRTAVLLDDLPMIMSGRVITISWEAAVDAASCLFYDDTLILIMLPLFQYS